LAEFISRDDERGPDLAPSNHYGLEQTTSHYHGPLLAAAASGSHYEGPEHSASHYRRCEQSGSHRQVCGHTGSHRHLPPQPTRSHLKCKLYNDMPNSEFLIHGCDPNAMDHHHRCDKTSSMNLIDITSEDFGSFIFESLTPKGSVCDGTEREIPVDEEPPRTMYCKWIKKVIPAPPPKVEKPDFKKTLRELGLKYADKFGDTKCVMIDLSGTLHIGNKIMDGAVEALAA